MNACKFIRAGLLASVLIAGALPAQGIGSQHAVAPAVSQVLAQQEGQHDFDFEIGKWKTHVSRLQQPLTGSKVWLDYEGTSVVRKIWNGRANLIELEVDGRAGRIELLSLRLYDPATHQWSLNVASSRGGGLGVPTVGGFKNGRGEFYDKETLDGRDILVRFVVSKVNDDVYRFEQAFSADGGKTWEVNWIATDTRIRTYASPEG